LQRNSSFLESKQRELEMSKNRFEK
jgi:hypothetical protein